MNVKILKFKNGDEVICDLEEIKAKAGLMYKCRNPLLVGFNDTRLVFIPFMQYTTATQEFEVSADSVLFVTEPVESLITDYQNATSKIVTPRKGILRSVE